jgi:hypothetical protein
MVGGVLADTRELMRKHASIPTDDPTPTDDVVEDDLAIEGEKLASALEYVADRMDEGDLVEDAPETSLEQVKQAYEIVAQVEADPRLKLKIAMAVGQLPRSPGMGTGIIPGKAPATALANDLKDRPGGGGRQARAQAKAPSQFQIPHSPAPAKSIAPGEAPDAMPTDLDDRPGGGSSYPEKGVIRTKSAASRVMAWGKIMKTAGEFKHDPAKDEGNKSAKISGARSQGPLGKPQGAYAWGEGPRSSLPSEIQSSAGARDYTKNHMAADLGKVLSHPAFSKKYDDVTTKNLSAAEVSKLAFLAGVRKDIADNLAINTPTAGGKLRAAGDTLKQHKGKALLAAGTAGLAAGTALAVRGRRKAKQQLDADAASEKNAGFDKLASLANSELLDRALRGEVDPSVLTKLAESLGNGGVDAATGITIDDSSGGTIAPDDKAVAFRQALEQSARHKGEAMQQSSDVVGMPGGSTGDATTPAIPSY